MSGPEDKTEPEEEDFFKSNHILLCRMCAMCMTIAFLWFINLAKSRWGIVPPEDVIFGIFALMASFTLLNMLLPDVETRPRNERLARIFLLAQLGIFSFSILAVPVLHIVKYGIQHTACLFNPDERSELHANLQGRIVAIKDEFALVSPNAVPWYEPRSVDAEKACPVLAWPLLRGPIPHIGEPVVIPLAHCLNPAR